MRAFGAACVPSSEPIVAAPRGHDSPLLRGAAHGRVLRTNDRARGRNLCSAPRPMPISAEAGEGDADRSRKQVQQPDARWCSRLNDASPERLRISLGPRTGTHRGSRSRPATPATSAAIVMSTDGSPRPRALSASNSQPTAAAMSNTFARVAVRRRRCRRMPHCDRDRDEAIAISHGTDGPFSTGSRIANATADARDGEDDSGGGSPGGGDSSHWFLLGVLVGARI